MKRRKNVRFAAGIRLSMQSGPKRCASDWRPNSRLTLCDQSSNPRRKMYGDTVRKCEFPDGVRIFPDGRNELDACQYEEIERWRNVTVSVLRCKVCGYTELAWYRQDDTEPVDLNADESEFT